MRCQRKLIIVLFIICSKLDNMDKRLLFSLFLFLSIYSYAQDGYYTMPDKEGLILSVDRPNKGDYLMSFYTTFYNDVIVGLILSEGTYSDSEEIRRLVDRHNGMEFMLEKSNDNDYIVKKGFCFMTERCLVFNPITYDEEDEYEYDDPYAYFYIADSIQAENERETFRTQDSVFELQPGKYVYHNMELYITTESRYSLYCFDIVFSEGWVSREGNVLLLHDDCMDKPFYALVVKDGIIRQFMTCYNYENRFVRVSNEQEKLKDHSQ